MTLTPEQLHILQHSLGCDAHGETRYRGRDEGDWCWYFSRNRYVSDPTPDLLALVAAGLMRDCGMQQLAGGMHYYRVTEAGRDAMIAQSPNPPVLTRGQLRYREWQDADCGLGFGEWLKARRTFRHDWERIAAEVAT